MLQFDANIDVSVNLSLLEKLQEYLDVSLI